MPRAPCDRLAAGFPGERVDARDAVGGEVAARTGRERCVPRGGRGGRGLAGVGGGPGHAARVARLRGRAGQFTVRRGHADHEGQRRAVAGGVDLSRWRHGLQPRRRARHHLYAGAWQRDGGRRRRDRQGAVGVGRDQGVRHPWRQLLGERRRQGSAAALQHAEHAAGPGREDGQAHPDLRQGRRRRPARGPRPRRGDRRAAEPPARTRLRAPAHPRVGHQPRIRLRARRHPCLRRPHRRARVVLPDHPAHRGVRRRHVAGQCARHRRRREQLGRVLGRRRARHRLRADGQRQVQLLRWLPPRRQPVLGQPDRARRPHRPPPLALPDGASRHLGRGQQLRAAADYGAP